MHICWIFLNVKGYRLLQPHFHDIIIRRDVKFDENLLACEPDSTIIPSSSSSSSFLDSFPTPVSDDDSEDETHLHLLMFLQLHQHQYFLDGFVQHVKQLVILPVILEINVEHVLSFSEPLLFWIKFLIIMIQKIL